MIKNNSLNIEVEEVEPGEYLPFLKVVLDGVERKLLLDTGAYKSSIKTDDWSSQYPAIESDQTHFSIGASGVKVKCDLIEIKNFEIGNTNLNNHRIERCRSNIFGLDLIGDVPFELDYRNSKLNYVQELDESTSQKLGRMKKGHLTVRTKLNEVEFNTILDTGATATIVDLSYVKKHPELFKILKRDDGTDGHSGESIESYRYELCELIVGDKTLKNISIISFDFPENMKKGFEGSPIMIGNNIIRMAAWQFDLTNMLWRIKDYTD
ncbi:aspartyl protease family protein [Halobacteriovorax sp. GB3]|uniref:aspartyl protease family protein n=1 Tax=Halobacteriovorax sp. GB3 TaxID=2719615 RepID=UPI00235EB524|nr:aspartyl protease family protein [Halobacteriovorax sp. GB3]MDD0852114.1 aspartyl protease family protein [Halobacteriovorax sp. GB3]